MREDHFWDYSRVTMSRRTLEVSDCEVPKCEEQTGNHSPIIIVVQRNEQFLQKLLLVGTNEFHQREELHKTAWRERVCIHSLLWMLAWMDKRYIWAYTKRPCLLPREYPWVIPTEVTGWNVCFCVLSQTEGAAWWFRDDRQFLETRRHPQDVGVARYRSVRLEFHGNAAKSEESTTTSPTALEELAGKTWSPKDLTTRTQVTVCVGGGGASQCVYKLSN